MSAPAATVVSKLPQRFQSPGPSATTLLDLVGAVCDVTDDESEVVATVLHMIRTGQVRLRGNFRGCPKSDFS